MRTFPLPAARSRRRRPALLAASACLLLAGCGGGGGPEDFTPDPEDEGCIAWSDYGAADVPVQPAACWLGGLVADVAVDGDLAVLASSISGLRVVDVADPEAPRLLGAADLPTAVAVDLQGGLAALAEGDRGFSLWSLDDPQTPALLARIRIVGAAAASAYTDAVLLAGDRLFIAGYHDQVVCYGIADPSAPVELGRVQLEHPGALALAGDRLVAGGRAVVAVAADGSLAVVQDLGRGPALDAAADGERIHLALDNQLVALEPVGDRLAVTDVRSVARIESLAVLDGLLWVGSRQPDPRLRAYDFRGGFAPELVSETAASGLIVLYSLAPAGGTLLVGDRWLQGVDVGDPRAPVILPAPEEPAYPQDMAVLGDRAVVVDGPRLYLYAVADGWSTVPLVMHDVVHTVLHVAAGGSRVYAARSVPGLVVIDPAQAAAEPVITHADRSFGVMAATDSLLVTGYDGELRVYTLDNADAPAAAGVLDCGEHIRAVDVRGRRALVALSTSQLILVGLDDPHSPVILARDAGDGPTGDPVAVVWADSVGLDYLADGVLRLVRPVEGALRTLATVPAAGDPRGLAEAGGVAYALDGEAWGGASFLTAVDLKQPDRPRALGRSVRDGGAALKIAVGDDRIHTLTTGGVLRWWRECPLPE